MGTYDVFFENNAPEKVCPYCGKSRPLDWFGEELKVVIRDKRTYYKTKVFRYRKYVACWRCRNAKGIYTLSNPKSATDSYFNHDQGEVIL